MLLASAWGVCKLRYANFCCLGNATTRRQKKGAIAFAYPVEYPRRMTDRGMYAKISAYRDGLNTSQRNKCWGPELASIATRIPHAQYYTMHQLTTLSVEYLRANT